MVGTDFYLGYFYFNFDILGFWLNGEGISPCYCKLYTRSRSRLIVKMYNCAQFCIDRQTSEMVVGLPEMFNPDSQQ